MNSKRLWIGLLVALVAAGVGYWQFGYAKDSGASPEGSYVTVQARIAPIEVSISGTGSVVASDKRTVRPPASATVAEVHAKEGDTVSAGQVVVTLYDENLLYQLEQARADFASQLLRLDSYRTPTEADLKSALAKLAQAEATLEARQRERDKLIALSPSAGRVLSVRVNPGDSVSQSTVLLTIVDDTEVFVVVQVAQQDIAKVVPGQVAQVAFGAELPLTTGVVQSVAVEASSGAKSVTVPVYVKVANPEAVYRSGLSANVTISVAQSEYVSAVGTVQPIARYEQKAEVSGVVETLYVSEADSVTKGQPLVAIANTSLDASIKQAESDIESARQALLRVESGLLANVSDADIVQQELRVEQARAQVASREAQVRALEVRSPIDGVVTSIQVAAGDSVVSNTSLFSVSDFSAMSMVIPVDELDIPNVFVGQEASVRVEALPGRVFSAKVSKIAAEGTVRDGIATYDVTLALEDTTSLRGSMTANATIVIQSKPNALLVPSEAVRSVTTGVTRVQGAATPRRVTVLNDGVPEQREVMVGLSNGVFTEILSGLEEGDVVVISVIDQGSQTQTPLMPVTPSQPGSGGGGRQGGGRGY